MAQVIIEIPSEEVIQSVREEPGLQELMENVKTHDNEHVRESLGEDSLVPHSLDMGDM